MSKSRKILRQETNLPVIDDSNIIEDLKSMKITRFMQKYGTKWRWAVLVHIVQLLKQLDIEDVDLERLAFTASFKESSSNEEVEEFFQVLFNLISKSCLVKTDILPIEKSLKDSDCYLVKIH
ncbi:MAG: hypothetical protein ACTSP4_06165 [Candidatus Hodarchaeales archaeon]